MSLGFVPGHVLPAQPNMLLQLAARPRSALRCAPGLRRAPAAEQQLR